MIVDPASSVHVSIVSLWEYAIKRSLPARRTGWLDAPAAEFASDVDASNVNWLGLSFAHAIAVETLPRHHGDPFDRLLVAQAMHEPMQLVTSDAALPQYSENVILV